jgi:hypothetical protein
MRHKLVVVSALFVAGGVVAPVSAQTRSETCRVERPLSTDANPNVTATVTMARDQSCTIVFRMRAVSERLLTRPGNGTVAFGVSGATYRPRPGFVGQDSFVVESTLSPDDPAITQPRRMMTVNVTVQREPPPSSASAETDPSWPACEVSSGRLTAANPSHDVQMRTRSNGRCSVVVYNQPDMRLDVSPQNGGVSVERGRATYAPNPGFRGADRFSVGWGHAGYRQQLHVSVDVR